MRLLLALALIPAVAHADDPMGTCTKELDARGVSWQKVKRPGIKNGVEVTGPLGGVMLTSEQPLVVDCSLAVSLDEAGKYLAAAGVEKVHFSSAYSRRNVRGTKNPSKHSYGLAIDIHSLTGTSFGTLRIDRDYEQGLGDGYDCVGTPLTKGGAVLKVLHCQLVRSGLFHLALSPDYDDAHHDHFHLEAKPWNVRDQVRSSTPAIH